MNQEMKERLKLFGLGAGVGTGLSILLLMGWFTSYEPPAEVTKRVVVSSCDLKSGETLTEKCIEIRDVAERFVPPGGLEAERLPYALNKKVKVDVPSGHAFRGDDIEGLPPRP